MTEITLRRISTGEKGTFGALIRNNVPLCVTLEEPDNGNRRGISCIPAGRYSVVRHNGTRFKNVWRLEMVPNRDFVLIHNGNTTDDVEGCILVGLEHGVLKGKKAVLRSTLALDILRKNIGVNNSFTLEIF